MGLIIRPLVLMKHWVSRVCVFQVPIRFHFHHAILMAAFVVRLVSSQGHGFQLIVAFRG